VTVPACPGVTRNRNSRLAPMRQLLPLQNAIVGIDLADSNQAAVVTGHDWRVIAWLRVTVRAWELGGLLDWAVGRAAAAGFVLVTVACEPAGHRWRVPGPARRGAGPGAGVRAAAAGPAAPARART
jgi:transposase